MHILRAIPVAAVTLALAAGAARAQSPDGQALYRQHCRSCHGANGVPPERAREQYEHIATLSDSLFQARRSDDSLMAVLRRGVGRDMKSFSAKMTADEMRAVVQFLRTMPRHHGS